LSCCIEPLNVIQIEIVLNFFIKLKGSSTWSKFVPDKNLINSFIYYLSLHTKSEYSLLSPFNKRVLCSNPFLKQRQAEKSQVEKRQYEKKRRKNPYEKSQAEQKEAEQKEAEQREYEYCVRQTELSKADYFGLVWLKPLLEKLILYDESNMHEGWRFHEYRYLKSCLLLAHTLKTMSFAPHIVFYLRFSKF
jgi:hypothetical protein